jgi:mycothiol synthase
MKITQQKYSGDADKGEMAALARAFPAENMHMTDLPYRLSSWALDDPDNIGLWVDEGGQLVAWAVMQTPFWTIDYAYRPDADKRLHQEILVWADQRAQMMRSTTYGLPAWYVNVFADQSGRRHDLEKAGFASQAEVGEDSWSKVWMQRDAQTPVPTYPLPAGFVLRPLAGEGEVEAYVELHRAVFETKNMTVEWRMRTLIHPDYIPELDMVVATPDGRLAAFCIGWLNQHPGEEPSGQIEPLGCHADFRKYALGRVALCETLRRLEACGAKSIFVETDSYRNTSFRLYESVGFQVIRNVLVYRKDYNDPASR